MAECDRCKRDTDCTTLDGRWLCTVCIDWVEDHDDTRSVDQQPLSEF